ncbi:MAG TPA: hypothetical protein VL967_05965 [Terracidiphilus sp.]|nr:hypothetical protein [Terracidiphilus sp.]
MESRIALRGKYSGPLLRPAKKFPEMTSVVPAPPPQIEAIESEEQTVDSSAPAPKSSKKAEIVLIACALALLLVNVAGTWISFQTATAAKNTANETNRLTRLLLRGTAAAHIVTNVVSQAIGLNNRQIRVSFRNDGKVNALDMEGSATVCLLSFPAGEKLACKTIPVSKSQLRFEGDEVTLGFDGIVGAGDLTLLENDRATVQYVSNFRFNDGFDDWVNESSCQLYFVRHFLSTDGVQERNWANCDVGKNILLAEVRRRADQ